MTPFAEAQADIKPRLRTERINKEYVNYLAQLRKKTPIWTIYDELRAPGQSPHSSISRNPNRP